VKFTDGLEIVDTSIAAPAQSAAARVPTGMIFLRDDHGSGNPPGSMALQDFVTATHLLAGGC